MAASKFSRFRGIRSLPRICMFAIAAITVVLLGVGLKLSVTDELYADGLGPFIYILALPSVSLFDRRRSKQKGEI